jgi:hypothetical protein
MIIGSATGTIITNQMTMIARKPTTRSARGQRTPVQQAARAQHRGAQVLGHLGLGGARRADAAQGAGEHG